MYAWRECPRIPSQSPGGRHHTRVNASRPKVRRTRTGVKCLPVSKVQKANGNGIHDWHAEVLAMRAFNHYLLTECRALAENPNHESFVLQRGTRLQPFEVRDGVRLYLYASEAPCTSIPIVYATYHLLDCRLTA